MDASNNMPNLSYKSRIESKKENPWKLIATSSKLHHFPPIAQPLKPFDPCSINSIFVALNNENNIPKQYVQTAVYTMLAGVKKTAAGGAACGSEAAWRSRW
jgi:hypothetical protein